MTNGLAQVASHVLGGQVWQQLYKATAMLMDWSIGRPSNSKQVVRKKQHVADTVVVAETQT